MKSITFTIKKSPVDKMDFSADSIVVKFKSGASYRLSVKNYLNGVKKQFEGLKSGKVSLDGVESSVLKAINEKIMEDAAYRKIKYPVTVQKVAVEITDPAADGNNDDTGDLPEFNATCASILSLHESKNPAEDLQENTMNYLEQFFLTQDLKCLSRMNGLSWVVVNTADDIYKKMYFYTRYEVKNGYQVWYKAYDPIIWFGLKI